MAYKHHFNNFRKHKFAFLFQCSLAGLAILVLLLSLKFRPNDVVVASLGASAYIIFAMPHKEIAKSQYIIGGYLCGILIGILFHLLVGHWDQFGLPFALHNREICGSIAVALSIFFMAALNVEHPPAAALSLGLVINDWRVHTIIVIVIAIVILVLYRKLFRHTMIDL
jgi:CBS-domain-containing membrane protein